MNASLLMLMVVFGGCVDAVVFVRVGSGFGFVTAVPVDTSGYISPRLMPFLFCEVEIRCSQDVGKGVVKEISTSLRYFNLIFQVRAPSCGSLGKCPNRRFVADANIYFMYRRRKFCMCSVDIQTTCSHCLSRLFDEDGVMSVCLERKYTCVRRMGRRGRASSTITTFRNIVLNVDGNT